MNRLLTALALWMALCTAAFAQVRNATVTYTYLGVQLRGFRVGEELMLPLDRIAEIGWSASKSASLTKLSAEGKVLTVPSAMIEGLPCIPFRSTLTKLGGVSNWISGGYDALEANSHIQSISVKAGEVTVNSGLKVRPTVSMVGSGDPKVVIDLDGACLSNETKLELDSSAKVLQYRPNSVRIVLNFRFNPTLPERQLKSAQQIVIDFKAPSEIVAPPVQRPDPAISDTTIVSVEKLTESETSTHLKVDIAKPSWKGIATIRRPSRDVIEVAMPTFDAKLANLSRDFSPYIKNVAIRQDTGLTILSLHLDRRMGVDLIPTAEGFQLTLIHPIGNGSLKGKLIVIDAGHGGKWPGTGNGEYTEKKLTLPTAMAVKRALEAEGATVVMTRETDTNFRSDLADDLIYRAEIANKNNADIFLSFHYDDSGNARTVPPSGTKSIYHGGRESDKYLAECIQEFIKSEGMLPNLGAVNDRRFAANEGFSVLRNSKMPAILMECAFVRNPSDRKVILTDAFRDNIAKCVVKGLKMFFGQK